MTATTKHARLKDTMISASDIATMRRFYEEVVGLEVTQETDDFVMLTDPETNQSICLTDGRSVSSTSPGVEVDELEEAITRLERLGGSVRDRWEFGPMIGANCSDPEGNELLLWQH